MGQAMKKTILQKHNIPYSLHDMIIKEIKTEENNITLIFQNGYTETTKPYKQVNGSIIIENADYDFCAVHLLSENGNYGNFKGKKLSLENFLKNFKEYSLEVVTELYGFNQAEYNGFINLPGEENVIEYSMSFYYTGGLAYITEE